MIDVGAVRSIINMFKSLSDDVRRSTQYLLIRMVEHGAIGPPYKIMF